MINIKKQILTLLPGLILLGTTSSTPAQGTLTITGTGSGTLNGVGFTDDSFLWVLNYSTTAPYTGFGADSTVYTTMSSQITLNGGSPVTVTGSTGTWLDYANSGDFDLAPMQGIPGSNILTIYGTPGWNGTSAFTSQANPGSSFSQFNSIVTDNGPLTISSGSVSLVTLSGAAVPEPSTLALTAVGGLGWLLLFRKRKVEPA
jgi:hypothetical protein